MLFYYKKYFFEDIILYDLNKCLIEVFVLINFVEFFYRLVGKVLVMVLEFKLG